MLRLGSDCTLLRFALAGIALASTARTAGAQPTLDEVLGELATLRREVQQLRSEVDLLRTARPARSADQTAEPSSGATQAPSQAPSLPPPLHPAESRQGEPADVRTASEELLAQQLSELAQVKVESGSRMPVRLFGTLHATAFYNSGEANWLDNPSIVPPLPAGAHTGTFGMGLRQTRLGLAGTGPTLGALRTSGTVVADFFGGIPGTQTGQTMPLPRLLVAYARLESDRTGITIGQDHVVLAPRDPTSLAALASPALNRSGNLYLRAPQVAVQQALSRHVRVTGALVAPIGGDLVVEDYRFVPPALGGERSRRPAFEARLALDSTADPDATRLASAGVSGHYGTERRPSGSVEAWASAVDFAFRRDWFGVAGELFTGSNIDAFGGGTGLDARAEGGWAELQIIPSSVVSFHAGGGLDELRGTILPVPARRRNRTAYGNAIFTITPEVQASVEYRWLGTLPGSGTERRNHHVDLALAYKF